MASVPFASNRLAALPSDGTVFDYHRTMQATPNPDAAAAAMKNFDDSVSYRLRQHGGRAFRAAAIDGLPHAYPFHVWVRSSLAEIAARRLERTDEGDDSLQFSSSLGAWRSVLDADFILVSVFDDSRNLPPRRDRVVAAAAGGGGVLEERPQTSLRFPWRTAVACVVHLETATIVWCNVRHAGRNEDLMGRAGAQAKVDLLLDAMLGAGDGRPVEPPPTGPALARATPVEAPGPPPPVPSPSPPVAPEPKLHAP